MATKHYKPPCVSGDLDYDQRKIDALKALRRETVQHQQYIRSAPPVPAFSKAELKRFQRLEKACTRWLQWIEGDIRLTNFKLFPVELAEELDFAAVTYALA